MADNLTQLKTNQVLYSGSEAGSGESLDKSMIAIAIQYSHRVGELVFHDDHIPPTAFDTNNPDAFWPAKCLDSIDSSEDISDTNFPDLVPYLNSKKSTYAKGTVNEKSEFDIINWSITSNVATLTFSGIPEQAIINNLLEDNNVHGNFTTWRCIELASSIGNIPAGVYEITAIDSALLEIEFAVTASDGSGSVTATVSFPTHKIAGSTTIARLFQVSGRAIVSANDTDGDVISGLRARDQMQGHSHNYLRRIRVDSLGGSGYNGSSSQNYQDPENTTYNNVTDGTNGIPRTGSYNRPNQLGAHVYIWGKRYVA